MESWPWTGPVVSARPARSWSTGLVARDTIEERVMALRARMADLFANVTGGGEFDAR